MPATDNVITARVAAATIAFVLIFPELLARLLPPRRP